MSTPSVEVHAGRLSVQLQALTFSVADVLTDHDPLVRKYINFKTRLFKMGRTKSSISRGLPTSPQLCIHCFTSVCFSRGNTKKDNSLYLAESCLHQTNAQYSIVRVFGACKSNIKPNKNVTAYLNHVKTTQPTSQPRWGLS